MFAEKHTKQSPKSLWCFTASSHTNEIGLWSLFLTERNGSQHLRAPSKPSPPPLAKYKTISFHKRTFNGTESRANCNYCQEGPLKCPLKQREWGWAAMWALRWFASLSVWNFVMSWCFSHRQIPVQTRARPLPLPLRRRHLPPQEWHARRHLQGESGAAGPRLHSGLSERRSDALSSLFRVCGSSAASTASSLLLSGRQPFSFCSHS